jgi:Ca2+/Na+ antiporter
MLGDLSLTHLDAAQLLHVSLRTLQNWLRGRHEVPYAAYKLLRLMRYMELPGESWTGWHFSRGQLVTPEGRTISRKDGSWWSLLVRRAYCVGELYRDVQIARSQNTITGGAMATPIGVAVSMNGLIIGASIVAVGTSVPELAATVMEKLRGDDVIGLGYCFWCSMPSISRNILQRPAT